MSDRLKPTRVAVALDVIALVVTIIGAAIAMLSELVPELKILGKIVGGALVVLAALVAFIRSRVEAAAKATLAQALDAERVRTRTNVNARLQTAVLLVQGMASRNQAERQTDLPRIQEAIVNYAVDMVKAFKPRAAYFRIVSNSNPRRMELHSSASSDRTDQSTRVFTEGRRQPRGLGACGHRRGGAGRNVTSHRMRGPEKQERLEQLAALSLFARWVERATVVRV